MLDGLQPQKLDAGALSVGALARLMREERQRQPDKKIHLVLDDRAAEAVGGAGGAAWCRQVGAARIYALGADVPDTDDVLRVVVTNAVEKARQQNGPSVLAAAPPFAPFAPAGAGRNCRVGEERSRSHVCQAGWRFFFLIPWNRYRSKSALFARP